MKKILTCILALAFVFSLSACGKSDAAIACEEAINAIGEVSLSAESALSGAEKAYNALSDKEKEQISGAAKQLVEAREKFNVLNVQSLINGIGEVTSDSLSVIEEAEKAYEALSDKEKEMLGTDADTLKSARATYEEAKKVVEWIDLSTAKGAIRYVGVEKANSNLLEYDKEKNCALIKFEYTNYQNMPAQVQFSFEFRIFQNGAECNDSVSRSSGGGKQYELCSSFFDEAMKDGKITFARLVALNGKGPLTVIVNEDGNRNNYQMMEIDISTLS